MSCTADDWIAQDKELQRRKWEETGTKLKLTKPSPLQFASSDEYNKAIAGRFVYCTKPEHKGDRFLPPGKYDKKSRCLECEKVSAASRRVLKEHPGFDTAEKWYDHAVENAKREDVKYPYIPAPKTANFPDNPVELKRAEEIHYTHYKAHKAEYMNAKRAKTQK